MCQRGGLNATCRKIFMCNFSNFYSLKFSSMQSKKHMGFAKLKGVPGRRKHFRPIHTVHLEDFPQLEANNLLWLWAESPHLWCLPYCCLPDYEPFKGNNY